MSKINFIDISKQRSLLPRRNELRDRRLSVLSDLKKLEQNYQNQKRILEHKLDEINLQIQSYSLTSDELEFMGRSQSVCMDDDVHGVYAILLNGETVYVGESADVRERLFTHAKGILRESIGFEMYAQLNRFVTDIDFVLLEKIVYPDAAREKLFRLEREGSHIVELLAQGVKLFNKSYFYQGSHHDIDESQRVTL